MHPVLLWPEGLSEKLDDAHLEAVYAHELCHIRRRDNLTSAIHMIVEAIFWFHPLVWWIGARLVERTRARLRRRRAEPGKRAASLRRKRSSTSANYTWISPLACVSGVTGADLKKRIEAIMTNRIVRNLNFARKLLLWTAACLAIALPIAFGLFNATPDSRGIGSWGHARNSPAVSDQASPDPKATALP